MKRIYAVLFLIFMASIPFISGCNSNNGNTNVDPQVEPEDPPVDPEDPPVDPEDPPVDPEDPPIDPPPSGPTKVVVKAHTLQDNNPPVDPKSKGQQVNEDTWNSFRYAADSKFYDNYNYTYYASTSQMIEEFTKDGYHMKSSYGELLYERKSGSTFYTYTSTKEGYLREETTFDIRSKYVDRIKNEIYSHMFDFKEYNYISSNGTYRYDGYSFTSTVKIQGGLLTYLSYVLGSYVFEIKLSFETKINIPDSYYFE